MYVLRSVWGRQVAGRLALKRSLNGSMSDTLAQELRR